MDFYVGLLAAVWLGAASVSVWVYQTKAKQAAEQLQDTTDEYTTRLLSLQIERDAAKAKFSVQEKENKLIAAQRRASAEVELLEEPKKKKKYYLLPKKKQCKPEKKHKRSRDWDD